MLCKKIHLMNSTPFFQKSYFPIFIVRTDVVKYAFFPSTKTILEVFLIGIFDFLSDLKSIIYFFFLDFDRINVPSFIFYLLLGHLQRNETLIVMFEGYYWVQLFIVAWVIICLILSFFIRLLHIKFFNFWFGTSEFICSIWWHKIFRHRTYLLMLFGIESSWWLTLLKLRNSIII